MVNAELMIPIGLRIHYLTIPPTTEVPLTGAETANLRRLRRTITNTVPLTGAETANLRRPRRTITNTVPLTGAETVNLRRPRRTITNTVPLTGSETVNLRRPRRTTTNKVPLTGAEKGCPHLITTSIRYFKTAFLWYFLYIEGMFQLICVCNF